MRSTSWPVLLLGLAMATAIMSRALPGIAVPKDARVAELLARIDLQALGEKLFFDTRLSNPPGQSCATCHDPAAGWAGAPHGADKGSGIYPGAVAARAGNRKPMSAAYATQSPTLHATLDDGELVFVGGNFWDGRATGHLLGNAAADQAQGPFLNPVEQNLADAETLVRLVESGLYADLFQKVQLASAGAPGADRRVEVQNKFGTIALALAAFEHSGKVNAFSSKYDAYLKGKVRLTPLEASGLKVFAGKGKCADCHPHLPGPKGEPPLFTDFTYDNLGIPPNPENPWYSMPPSINPDGARWVDQGLGGFLRSVPQYAGLAEANLGKHRVPTLRNVDKRPAPDFVKTFGHNGYFKSLEAIVHFYNTRDILPAPENVADPRPGSNCWPRPEVPANMNKAELGNLKLTTAEEHALVAFMRTLSDGFVIPPAKRTSAR